MESGAAIQERVAQAQTDRPIYRYTIPANIANGTKSVGLVLLTTDEELRATKRSHTDTHRLAYELSKQALVEVDGKPVNEGDGSIDTAWDAMSPKVRGLVLVAYASLHTPEDEETTSFLKSQQVSVG